MKDNDEMFIKKTIYAEIVTEQLEVCIKGFQLTLDFINELPSKNTKYSQTMKIYKPSITSFTYLIFYPIFILQLTLNLFNGRLIFFKGFAIFFILSIIILVITKARYILNDQYLIIKELLVSKKIDIMTIDSISIKKVQLFKKYMLEIKTGRFNRTYLYPRQADMDNFITDMVDINPNIIVNQYILISKL